MDRVGKGVRTSPRDALISDSVSFHEQGAAFGIHRALDQMGVIVGPLTATFVMVLLGWTMREVFLLSLIPSSMALLVILFGVREIVAEETREFSLLQGMREVIQGKFLILLVIVGVFSLGAYNFSFILLNAREMGVGDPPYTRGLRGGKPHPHPHRHPHRTALRQDRAGEGPTHGLHGFWINNYNLGDNPTP
jgi:MFS family permease